MADTGAPFAIPYVEPTDLVRNYPAASEDLADAIAGQFGKGFQFAGQRIYTSSGTFNKADPLGTGDIGLRAIRVRVQGGGGAGGGAGATSSSQGSGGSGGSGGNFTDSFITDIAGLPTSITVTRGAGGSGASNANGNPGAASSFDSLVAAAGGNGGTRSAASTFTRVATGGSSPTTGFVGDLQIRGGTGEPFYFSSFDFVRGVSAVGGSSQLGGAGQGRSIPGGDGFAGVAFGGGGGGAFNAASQSDDRVGGAGANGIVIVEVFV